MGIVDWLTGRKKTGIKEEVSEGTLIEGLKKHQIKLRDELANIQLQQKRCWKGREWKAIQFVRNGAEAMKKDVIEMKMKLQKLREASVDFYFQEDIQRFLDKLNEEGLLWEEVEQRCEEYLAKDGSALNADQMAETLHAFGQLLVGYYLHLKDVYNLLTQEEVVEQAERIARRA